MSNELEGNVILVIDDDEINLQMAKMILEKKLPCRVITCDNGIQGIEIMQRQYVRLVLLDIVMPFFDGIQTLEKIRQDPKLKNMPVMMLTASADKKHIAKAIQLGIKDYVKKPFMPEDLVSRVSKKLGPITTKSKPTLLLIDDDEDSRKRTKTVLENSLPHEVIAAASGIDGMEVLRKQKVNLVVASADMSFINGYRIVDFMKGDDSLKKIPAFLIVTSDDAETVQKVELSGAKGHLKKPLIDASSVTPLIEFLKASK